VFPHRALGKHTGAGFYFHVSPDEVLAGGGIYAPGTPELLAIRRHIAENDAEFRAVLNGRAFRRLFGEVTGEKLKRVPKGFPADHPSADLLVYKQFLALSKMPPETAATARLQPELLKRFKALAPLVEFLDRLAGVAQDLGRKAQHLLAEQQHQFGHGSLELLFVDVLAGLEPLPAVVVLQAAQKLETFRREAREPRHADMLAPVRSAGVRARRGGFRGKTGSRRAAAGSVSVRAARGPVESRASRPTGGGFQSLARIVASS